jgi:hypothetical protein
MRINGPSEDQIRTRAYEIYLERGGQPGHDRDDWFQAEFELTHLPFHVPNLLPLTTRRGFLRRRRGRLPVRFPKQ